MDFWSAFFDFKTLYQRNVSILCFCMVFKFKINGRLPNDDHRRIEIDFEKCSLNQPLHEDPDTSRYTIVGIIPPRMVT